MTEEQYCHQMLDLLTQQYQKDCKPFTERLIRLTATRPIVMYIMNPSALTDVKVKIFTDLDIYKDTTQKETPDLSDRG